MFVSEYRKITSSVIFAFVLLIGCNKNKAKFVQLSSDKTNISFTNKILESDSVNIFDFSNIYNGGGVGVGDFNNDGLQDLYFTGNMVPNKLYLNKGKMEFEDITTPSATDGGGIWSRGVAVIDINNDGLMDMYVCATAKSDPLQRINILYVNQGVDKKGIPIFKNMANEYGLADTTQSTMAYFFDYDNDDDLDLFIGVNHIIKDEYANIFRKKNVNNEHPSTCKLYRNDWNENLKHSFFTNVSIQAGITIEGYTHAVNIFDANNDGWQDILVLNDYVSDNVLYINNHNGTFTDRVKDYFKHTAANSMGSDAVDINNDGLKDIVEVDMAPQDNFRKKMFQNFSNYQMYLNSDRFGYQYQYPRNMLQLNMGNTIKENDSIAHPVFGDIGFLANIAETDWSWCPLVADFDHDGNKDIIFTNGFPKDITDHDFMTFRQRAISLTSKKDMLAEIPEVKIHNYAYKNNGKLKFDDVSYKWGLDKLTFSSGAAYADLDNDGDLDIIISNINDPASVYENNLNTVAPVKYNYLAIKLIGSLKNLNGIGASVKIYQKDTLQLYDNMPYRGYISTQSMVINAGIGNTAVIDSVVIEWPNKKKQKLTAVNANQTITVNYKDAEVQTETVQPVFVTNNWFTNITSQSGINYIHNQWDFIDFNIQKQIPHKLSEYAPGIAAGDINGDGLDDFVTASSPGYSPMIFTQTQNGTFMQSALLSTINPLHDIALKKSDDRGLLLFDADNDGDLDLFIASGGYAYNANDSGYCDNFYINDGKGKFTLNNAAIPFNTVSKFCVRACDYDKDGDLDLFVSGRVMPHAYPKPVSSFIYRNDLKDGKIVFTDVTKEIAPVLQNIGLVCDALFTDYDNDGWLDLVLAGEWMPITFLHNEHGKYSNTNKTSGIETQTGWWNSINAGDFDNDGDVDYVVGNLGLNSFYRASTERPVSIRANYFDANDSYDAIPSLYLPATTDENAAWYEYPAFGREDMIKQVLSTRIKYQNFKSYALATIDSIVLPDKNKTAIKLSANTMTSALIINEGNGKFSLRPLPLVAQMSALNGMVVDDFNGDGNLDVAINTNDYSTESLIGRYDALNGLILKGDGNGNFIPLSIFESGLYINGNGKALSKIINASGNYIMVATQNKGPMQIYKNKNTVKLIRAFSTDIYATLIFESGKKQKQECYYGASFLSQGSRFFSIPNNLKSCSITDANGKTREVVIK
jgi:ASPIC and UnbV/FG-GAP-like repeat